MLTATWWASSLAVHSRLSSGVRNRLEVGSVTKVAASRVVNTTKLLKERAAIFSSVLATISWWQDEAAAIAWRDDPEHRRIRDHGRAVWYDWYRVIVATVDRTYQWTRPTGD